jgi:glycosyltransferase involved in cell wall biosynthesis
VRILFVHNKYLTSEGGEDTSVSAEAALLQSHGHIVKIVFFDNAQLGSGISGKVKAGISSIYNSTSAGVIREEIKMFAPDIVHVHNFFFQASPAVILEAKKCKVPVVVTIQNFRLICTNALLLRNNRVCELCVSKTFAWYGVKYKCYHNSAVQSAAVASMAALHKISGTWRRAVDQYITPAEFISAKLIHSSLKLDPAKVTIKRNFIADTGEVPGDTRQNFFLFVGRLSAEKGVDIVLQAFRNLSSENLVIVGDGPQLESLVKEYGQLENISFAGKKSKGEVMSLMKQCRALIFPSIWYEGLPLTIIEAFSTGTPVIASRLGAMAEMIIHDVNGLHFEPGNAIQLFETVGKFKKQIEEKNYLLYKGARQSYLNHYHPEKCYLSVIAIYNNLVSKVAANTLA